MAKYHFEIIMKALQICGHRENAVRARLKCRARAHARSLEGTLSASRGDFVVPHARTAIKQHRTFSIVGPSLWNSLPPEIRSLPWDLSSSFYKLLKTFIFARAWAGSTSE